MHAFPFGPLQSARRLFAQTPRFTLTLLPKAWGSGNVGPARFEGQTMNATLPIHPAPFSSDGPTWTIDSIVSHQRPRLPIRFKPRRSPCATRPLGFSGFMLRPSRNAPGVRRRRADRRSGGQDQRFLRPPGGTVPPCRRPRLGNRPRPHPSTSGGGIAMHAMAARLGSTRRSPTTRRRPRARISSISLPRPGHRSYDPSHKAGRREVTSNVVHAHARCGNAQDGARPRRLPSPPCKAAGRPEISADDDVECGRAAIPHRQRRKSSVLPKSMPKTAIPPPFPRK